MSNAFSTMAKDSNPSDDGTTFYLVRHGETEYNRKGIVQGREINSTLNETGHAQAQCLAERLADVPFDAIYTSTLKRAEQTAAVLAKRHPEVPLYRMADLEEMSWGKYEGRPTTPDLLEAFEAIKAQWRAGAFDHSIDGGESILDVQERALRAIRSIEEQHRGQTVLVVAHGRFLRVLIASLLEEYGLEHMHRVKHDNTAVNQLVCRDGCYKAHLLNCTAHLEAVDSTLVE